LSPDDPTVFLAEPVSRTQPDLLHLESCEAIASLAKPFPFHSVQEGLPSVDLGEMNIVVVGGPAHGGLAWMIFGSAYDDRLEPAGDPYHLPYAFVPDEENEILRPLMNSNDFSPTVNWQIMSTGSPRSPATGSGGKMKSDFLLLSVLPNPLSGGQKSIVSFAGTHGVGTRAAALLLRDSKILQKLDDVRFGAFQMLFSVKEFSRGSAQVVDYIDHKEVDVSPQSLELLTSRIEAYPI
jgi:hypothetical protein